MCYKRCTCGIGQLGYKPEASAELHISSLETGSLSTANNTLLVMSMVNHKFGERVVSLSVKRTIPLFGSHIIINSTCRLQ